MAAQCRAGGSGGEPVPRGAQAFSRSWWGARAVRRYQRCPLQTPPGMPLAEILDSRLATVRPRWTRVDSHDKVPSAAERKKLIFSSDRGAGLLAPSRSVGYSAAPMLVSAIGSEHRAVYHVVRVQVVVADRDFAAAAAAGLFNELKADVVAERVRVLNSGMAVRLNGAACMVVGLVLPPPVVMRPVARPPGRWPSAHRAIQRRVRGACTRRSPSRGSAARPGRTRVPASGPHGSGRPPRGAAPS